ncbi:MAG: hypothetical protein ABEJ28_06310 [Salinigranum sp.]
MIEQLFVRLDPTECPHCESGVPSLGTFKGELAVVCESCWTPTVRPI